MSHVTTGDHLVITTSDRAMSPIEDIIEGVSFIVIVLELSI